MSSVFEKYNKEKADKKPLPPGSFELMMEAEKARLGIVPSTSETISRPQNENLPSTPENVDVLPSTDEPEKQDFAVKPSTKKNIAVHKEKLLPSTKGDRHDKTLARYDNRIESKIKQRIDMFCAEFDVNQKDFAEMSAVHFIEMWTAKKLKNVDGKTALDDRLLMMNTKTSSHIINIYRIYNPENLWKFRDDEIAAAFNQTDLRIIEIGIIITQIQAKFKRIHSFKYYRDEINNTMAAKNGDAMLGFLITHYRKEWSDRSGKTIDLSFLEK